MASAGMADPSQTPDDDGAGPRRTLAAAEAHCAAAHLRLTPVRRRTLEILAGEGRAIGAYALLDRLREEGLGAQPPVAYRALDFLVTNGMAHRLGGSGGYVACAHPGEPHTPALLVCRTCGVVEETRSAPAKGALGAAARASGFRIERAVVEAEGLCPSCVEVDP